MITKRTVAGAIAAIALGVGAGLVYPVERSRADGEAPDDRSARANAPAQPPPSANAPQRVSSKGALVTDPTAPGYDARRLMRAQDLRLWEVFALEPRSESFAAPRERYLETAFRSALDLLELSEYVDAISVECHTATCVVELSADPAEAYRVYMYLQIFPVGQTVSPKWFKKSETPDRARVTYTIAYDPEFVDHDAFHDWYETVLWRKGLKPEQGMPGLVDLPDLEGS